jgi:hypothetical protein
LDCGSGFLAKDSFVRHLATPHTVGRGIHTMHTMPDARGWDARCVNQGARWKAPSEWHQLE